MSAAVLDTDVASAILRHRQLPGPLAARLAGRSLAITFITLAELTAWTLLRNWGPRRLGELATWRRLVGTLPADELVATTWGMLHARAQRRGRPRPVNDMWVAACCIANDVPLATFNRKDFEDFARHDGLKLI